MPTVQSHQVSSGTDNSAQFVMLNPNVALKTGREMLPYNRLHLSKASNALPKIALKTDKFSPKSRNRTIWIGTGTGIAKCSASHVWVRAVLVFVSNDREIERLLKT